MLTPRSAAPRTTMNTLLSVRFLRAWLAAGALILLLSAYYCIYLPYLPNSAGTVGNDYSLWLPDLMVGYYWFLNNGLLVVPWFSPALCGGVPFQADPQVGYLSLPQFLTFVMPPIEAVRASVLVFAAAGFLGAYLLARLSFRLSAAAALLAGTLFMFNDFYAARMMIGHLTYQSYMLTPLLAALILAGTSPLSPVATSIACQGLAGFIIAAMVEAGAIHVLPPALLSVLIIIAIHAIRSGFTARPMFRLLTAIGIGCALSAGKLTASFALLRHFPRDYYSLPGIDGLQNVLWSAAGVLFLGPSTHSQAVNAVWALQRHEWEYGVTVIPPILMFAWVARFNWLSRPTGPWPWMVLCGLLLIPILLNWYQPAWNQALKALPIIGSSSNLLRWFASYILPAILGAACAFDAIVPPRARRALGLAAALGAVALHSVTDRSFYGPKDQASYGVAIVETAWHNAWILGTGPRITANRVLDDSNGNLSMLPNRQDAFAFGYSQLYGYEPLFGYNLERFPSGTLHAGQSLAAANGQLNVKNPACYVFPQANRCQPGDPFLESQVGDAQAFLSYQPFPFARPAWANVADWVGILAALALLVALAGAGGVVALRRARSSSASGKPIAPALAIDNVSAAFVTRRD
jgi:hypothetical protein